MVNRNEAYNFQLPVERKKKSDVIRVDKKIRELKKKRALEHKKFVASMVLMFSAFTTGFSALVFGQVKLTEATDKVEKATKELNQYKSLRTQLSMQRISQNSSGFCDGARGNQKIEIVHISKK